MNLCKRYRISGGVQGVFFRVSARDRAVSLGITGWVRNTEEGDVEVIACGNEHQLLQLEAWLAQGPPLAVVKNVTGETIEDQNFNKFSLRF